VTSRYPPVSLLDTVIARPWAHSGVLPPPVSLLDMPPAGVETGNIPEMGYPIDPVPEIDTGGER